jgi:hypothetical protein
MQIKHPNELALIDINHRDTLDADVVLLETARPNERIAWIPRTSFLSQRHVGDLDVNVLSFPTYADPGVLLVFFKCSDKPQVPFEGAHSSRSFRSFVPGVPVP